MSALAQIEQKGSVDLGNDVVIQYKGMEGNKHSFDLTVKGEVVTHQKYSNKKARLI